MVGEGRIGGVADGVEMTSCWICSPASGVLDAIALKFAVGRGIVLVTSGYARAIATLNPIPISPGSPSSRHTAWDGGAPSSVCRACAGHHAGSGRCEPATSRLTPKWTSAGRSQAWSLAGKRHRVAGYARPGQRHRWRKNLACHSAHSACVEEQPARPARAG